MLKGDKPEVRLNFDPSDYISQPQKTDDKTNKPLIQTFTVPKYLITKDQLTRGAFISTCDNHQDLRINAIDYNDEMMEAEKMPDGEDWHLVQNPETMQECMTTHFRGYKHLFISTKYGARAQVMIHRETWEANWQIVLYIVLLGLFSVIM